MKRKLFESGKIGNLKIKNRIILAPMGPGNMQNRGGVFNERIRAYYENIAKGGAGLIITGSTPVSTVLGSKGKDFVNTMLLDRSYIGGACETVDAVHHRGAKICIQLCISDGRTFPFGGETVCASAGLRSVVHPEAVSRAATLEELEQVIKDYGNVAALAKEAGFDAIEIRAYGGYFTDEFMTSLWNHRTDKYGGDLDGRLRFLMECIQSVQKACGKDYPLIVKFTPCHGMEGGRKIEEGKEIARRLQAAGVHALHLDYGCWDVHYNQIPPAYMPLANQVWLADEIKQCVDIPVISNGKLGVDPEIAEKVLEEGKTDFIALGRSLLADPEWPQKVKEGRLMDVRPCIGCMKCQERISSGRYISCAVNPQTGMEREFALSQAEKIKNVLVVGGGPGGAEAARVAALRGHNVTLVEKKSMLGGRLLEASAPSFKRQLKRLIQYYTVQLAELNVKVELGTEMTEELILKRKPDVVILATGAKNRVIEGVQIDKSGSVYNADQILLGEAKLEKIGKKILVVGGSEVGCETALHLSEILNGSEIKIATRQDELAGNTYFTSRLWIKKKIYEKRISTEHYNKLIAVENNGILVEEEGVKRKIDADTVILSLGYEAKEEFAERLEDKIEEVYTVGDTNRAREVLSAVWEGFHTARLI